MHQEIQMKVVALVLAGGSGTRLLPLTANHAKPALSFAGGVRIIDFVLSNLVNSGITSIYVVGQYKPESLIKHIGADWGPELRAPRGFLRMVLPNTQAADGAFLGTADAVLKNLHLCNRLAPDLVAVFAADHVYRMDVGQMIDAHVRNKADISVAAIPVPIEQASSFGVIDVEAGGRIRGFDEKPAYPDSIPARPTHAYVSMGNYLFDPAVLTSLLEESAARGETDFGHHVLPRAAATHRVFAYDFSTNQVPGAAPYEEPNYWRDVGTIEAYRAAQRDAVGPRRKFSLANAHWPMIRSASHGARAATSGQMLTAAS
jgi:glucose-1-phosphate adenylyltransferase